MSELKPYIGPNPTDYTLTEYNLTHPTDHTLTEYYLKSEADKVIAELEEERRWRKFPDEKPEWGKEVLVVDDESKHYIVRFSHDMKWISWGNMNTCESNRAKYWMPLPPAPKEADK